MKKFALILQRTKFIGSDGESDVEIERFAAVGTEQNRVEEAYTVKAPGGKVAIEFDGYHWSEARVVDLDTMTVVSEFSDGSWTYTNKDEFDIQALD